MCGINGIYGRDGISNPRDLVQGMNQALAHRGPDAEGVFANDQLVLGHRRLSIIDLSEDANQPMSDPSGRYTMVFNGEVYNFRQIKEWLKDYNFRTSSDTEVVLAAYNKWGVDAFSRFNGMFALAIWDDQENTLVIARDRLGIKPLYYRIGQSSVIFSSEIRALLGSGLVPREIDRNALVDYLRYQTVHAPHTLVAGVKKLLPGCYMKINDSEQSVHRYWDLTTHFSRSSNGMSYDEVKGAVESKFSEAVERRLVADVEFGAFLSGGIDSSAVVAMMARHSPDKVDTFTVTFAEEEFSEAKYARTVAKKFGTRHHEIKLSPELFLKKLPDALAAMDHPSGDGPNTYVVSQAVKDAGITMALSGLGGDELFAGYDVFRRSHKLENSKWAMSFAPGFRGLVAKPVKWAKRSVAGDKFEEVMMLNYWDVEHTYPVSRKVLLDGAVEQLLTYDGLPENEVRRITREALAHQTPGYDLSTLSKVSYAEIHTYMQNVLLRDTDQMSMAHALEVRVPFLDHELVEFVAGVSDEHKFPVTPKRLLVEALGDLLPESIVNRPKMGFTFPWAQWLKEDLRSFAEDHINSLGKRKEFNEAYLQGMWKAFINGDKRVTWSRIWYLIVLENWLARHIDG